MEKPRFSELLTTLVPNKTSIVGTVEFVQVDARRNVGSVVGRLFPPT